MSERFYWRAKFVKGGAWVPIMSYFGPPIIDGEEQDRSHSWQAIVRTETSSRAILFGDNCPIEVDDINLRNIERVEEKDYLYLRDHTAWATEHAPSHPEAQPTKAINLRGKSILP